MYRTALPKKNKKYVKIQSKMKKANITKANLVHWTELLIHAEDLGIEWNKAHDIIVRSSNYILPTDGNGVNIIDLPNVEGWNEGKDKEIVLSFMTFNELNSMHLHV